MKKLSIGQRKILAEFFVNGAVAWLSAGVITPFFIGRSLPNFAGSLAWGITFTLFFVTIALYLTKGIKS